LGGGKISDTRPGMSTDYPSSASRHHGLEKNAPLPLTGAAAASAGVGAAVLKGEMLPRRRKPE
jgi:hypothetical protein